MPTYEYQCERCGHQLERFQSINSRPLRKCPECGHPALKRLIGHGAGIIFKGSGFYETDYRSESYKKAQEKEKQASASTGGDKAESKAGRSGDSTSEKGKESKGKKTA